MPVSILVCSCSRRSHACTDLSNTCLWASWTTLDPSNSRTCPSRVQILKSCLETPHTFDPTNIFSIIANMTPFSDFNQSPRNMYRKYFLLSICHGLTDRA